MIYNLKIGYQRHVIPEVCEQIDVFEGVVNNVVNSMHIFYTGKAFQSLKEIWDYMFFETNGFMEAIVIKISYATRSEEHTSELQSSFDIVCRLLLAKKNSTSTDA